MRVEDKIKAVDGDGIYPSSCGKMFIAGIDEAGRGPVIGPMVVALVLVDENGEFLLKRIGVKDSKTLSKMQRLRLSKSIQVICRQVIVEVVQPSEIDSAVYGRTAKNLNDLEARIAARLIDKITFTPCNVYVDSPDVNTIRYRNTIMKYLSRDDIEIIVENDADKTYPVVSAASIIAKVKRDSIIEELKKVYGDFGSGYPSDPKTRAFLRNIIKGRRIPPIVRRSWKTFRNIVKQKPSGYNVVI